MFNHSKKYIALLVINIIVLVVFYVSQQNQKSDDPFDTQFVLDLMQKEDNLVASVKDLNAQLSESSEKLSQAQLELEQTQMLADTSEQNVLLCESEKDSLLASIKKMQSSSRPVACDAQEKQLVAANAKITKLQEQLNSLQSEQAQAQEALINANQVMAKAQNSSDKIEDIKGIEALQLQVTELQQIIKEPIYIRQHFLSAKYCDKPKYEGLICVRDFLIRPSFSKPPITRLGIKIIDNTGTTVTSGEFTASQSRLYTISMGYGKELPSGNYTVIYSVDNQTIRSKDVVLTQ